MPERSGIPEQAGLLAAKCVIELPGCNVFAHDCQPHAVTARLLEVFECQSHQAAAKAGSALVPVDIEVFDFSPPLKDVMGGWPETDKANKVTAGRAMTVP